MSDRRGEVVLTLSIYRVVLDLQHICGREPRWSPFSKTTSRPTARRIVPEVLRPRVGKNRIGDDGSRGIDRTAMFEVNQRSELLWIAPTNW